MNKHQIIRSLSVIILITVVIVVVNLGWEMFNPPGGYEKSENGHVLYSELTSGGQFHVLNSYDYNLVQGSELVVQQFNPENISVSINECDLFFSPCGEKKTVCLKSDIKPYKWLEIPNQVEAGSFLNLHLDVIQAPELNIITGIDSN